MNAPLRIRVLLAFAVIYLLWGSTYLGIRFAVETIPPRLMMGMRFFVSGGAILGVLAIRGTPLPPVSRWLPTAAVGIPLVTITYGLLAQAEQIVPSGLTALFSSIIPIWMVAFDWARPGGRRPRWLVVAGIALGVTGIGLLVNLDGGQGSDGVVVGGAVMLLFSTMSWSAGSIWSRHIRQPDSRAQSAGIMLMSGGALLLLIALISGEALHFDANTVSVKSWVALGYLTVVGMVGHPAYIWLLSVTPAARVSTYAFVNPIIALLLGALWAGEALSMRTLLCSIMIISAVVIIVLAKAKRTDSATRDFSRRPNSLDNSGRMDPYERATR